MDWTQALKKYGFTGLVLLILAGSIVLDTQENIYECSSTGRVVSAVGLSDSNKTAVSQYGTRFVCRGGEWRSMTETSETLPSPPGITKGFECESCNLQGCTPKQC